MDLLTVQPEKSPVLQPEKSPVLQRAKSPVLQPEKSPVLQPEKSPVLQPEKSTLLQPEKSPALQRAKSPVLQLEKSPVLQPEKSPVLSPKKSPVPPPRKSPVFPPRKSPDRQSILPLNTEQLMASKSIHDTDYTSDLTIGKLQHTCFEFPTTIPNSYNTQTRINDDSSSKYTTLVHRDRDNTYDVRSAPRQGLEEDGNDMYISLSHQDKPHTYDVRWKHQQSSDSCDDYTSLEYIYKSPLHQNSAEINTCIDDDGDYDYI